ncbi:ATP-binding protein [Glaciecola sp. KUL10]|uniref:ATP-binding protein n=1 Tax=Glaciecola sp. (strain KUL10) TaxID=2161813 RepID=UPI000D789549|nr:ATP-binding protein [Glaciecola sp. KUL10]GBL03022.1 signal transduction histidine kinase [Glaciecola sp. KUL10]
MQELNIQTEHSELIEKITNTGSCRYRYAKDKFIWTKNLYQVFNLTPNALGEGAEWDIPIFSEHTRRLIKTKIEKSEAEFKSFEIKLPYISESGADKWVKFCCEFIVQDQQLIERVSVFRDITLSIDSSEHNNFYKERVELALTSTKAGTWDYQVVSNELFWDESMFSLFEIHRPNRALKFSEWINHVHPDSKETFIDEFNKALKVEAPDHLLSFVVKILTPLGSLKYIKISARFYSDIFDKTVRVVGTCIDVTEQEIATNKILEQATIAQKNALIAQDANEARARFIANVSHEIRTPMNSILGTLQILDSYDFNDELKELISMATESSNDLLNVINDVLDLSKIDAQEMEIESIDIDVEKLIENAVMKFSHLLQEGVTLTSDIAPNLLMDRLGDPLRFNQVLNNLLSNAIKFTSSGSITLKLYGDDKEICVEVIDTGIGIDNDKLELIFEPFKQADDTTTRNFGGTGLGLAISKKLTQLMGGKLTVNSIVNQGSHFKFTAPLPATSQFISSTSNKSLSNSVPNLKEHCILYAEDNDASINIVKQLIRPTNAKLLTAINGRSAIELYRKTPSVSIVILDIQMPIMNGVEVCERIRAENKNIPIIALTANVMIEDQKKYFNMGYSQVIEKPIKFDKFYEALNKV